MALPRPFCPQKVTNANANEAITNFLIKTGTTIPYNEEQIRNIVRTHISFNGESLEDFPIIHHDEENNKITFSNRSIYDLDPGYWHDESQLKKDMIKDEYTFTACTKFRVAMEEITIRTRNLNNLE